MKLLVLLLAYLLVKLLVLLCPDPSLVMMSTAREQQRRIFFCISSLNSPQSRLGLILIDTFNFKNFKLQFSGFYVTV